MTATLPPTIARLAAPRVPLASCIRGYMVRSTLGVPLAPAQRVNRFPATPFCSITWMIAGSGELVEPATPGAVALPGSVIFSGPRTQPFATANPGPVHTLTALFFADALHALTGLDMAVQLDAMTLADDVLGEAWREVCAAVLAAPDDDARIRIFEDWLEPRWHAVRGDAVGTGSWSQAQDWVQSLAMRAALSGAGRSARMAERRVRAWAGHPLRTLRRLARVEESLLAARDEHQAGHVSLSDVALRSGYSDQAHLSREARELVGSSPREIIRLAQTDESYWPYRIWW
ncbi:AraC family transcriptional regulator [Pseudoduganella lutea]|uniref:AraC family transcriptional regulator n=1 Tax=Pseudoduganella lutea TaxID=321985 RepID=A0A4P6KZV3_9BURK|nr:helix-turn-helix domain-containing protein [Pseudoduganella lutea]QBE63868.1 AraC family transcriptional regulator [Pseudoduganella lutea]